MNNVLLTLGALLVGILSALVAVPMMVDWNSYRGAFEEEASRLLGRDVRVGGSVAVRLLPAPYVRFEKLRVADTASTSGDPLFRADSLTMRLSVGALLRGALEADEVDLQRPVLRLSADKDGQGNWRALQIAQGSLPFLPSNVALKSVGLTGGTLTMVGPSGRDLATFEAIDGEFAADSGNGPYRFKGALKVLGLQPAEAAREIRLSAGALDSDGSVKLRASVRSPSSGNTYNFDGKLADIREKLRVEGELSAKLPIAGAKEAKEAKADDLGAAYDLKGKLTGDVHGVRLADLSLALDSVTDPQLITGEVSTHWAAVPRFDMALASKSLNLDRFAAAGPDSDPLDTARAALNIVLGALPPDAEANARLNADRIILAGETVSGVSVAMARSGPSLELKSLRAELPGSTRLEATGVVSRDTRTLSFAGPVRVRGTNLARFLSWARGKDRSAAALVAPETARQKSASSASTRRYEGPFALAGDLSMAGGSIDLKGANADFGGMLVSGELNVQNEGRRKIALTLDADRLDLAQLWPGGFDPAALRALFSDPTAKTSAAPASVSNGFFSYDPAIADLALTVKVSELRNGGEGQPVDLKNVDIAAKVATGVLTVDRLKFVTAAGLDADFEGRIVGLPGTSSAQVLPAASAKSGTVRFSLVAPSTSALTEALSMAEIPTPLRPGDALLSSIGPARLAGTVAIGVRASGRGVDATFDGAIEGGRVHGTLALDGGLQSWRSAPLVANVTVDSPRAERWLEFAGLSTTQTARAIPGRGVVFIRGEGTPETGLTIYSTLSSPDVSAAYQGLVALPDGRPMQLDGIVALTARDAADALALSGIAPGVGATGAPVSGQVRLAYAGEMVTLETSGLTVGGSALTGKATVTAPGTPSKAVTARLSVDTVSVPGVLAALSDRRSARTDGDDALWPADPLSLSSLDNLTGTIDFTAQRAVIDGAVAVADLKTTVALAPGKFAINGLEAKAHGGTIRGQAALERMQGGSRFTAEASVQGIDAGRLNRSAAIPFSAKVTLSGQGASVRSIVSALAGSGEVALESGKISGVAPAAVAQVADRVLATRELPSMDDVSADIRRGLEGSVLDVKARKLPLKIADGTVRISSPPLETEAGQARFDVSFDLAALRQTHEWRIEARTAPAPSGRVKGLLPPISIVTTGSLAASENWTTNVNLTAFEQELSLRKIERDADELERARKLAEETRLKAEADEAARLAAIKSAEEAAKAAASTAAASTAGSAPGVQPGAPSSTQPPSGPASSPASLPGPPAGAGTAPVPISAPPLPRPPRPNPGASTPRPNDDVFLRPFQSP